VADFNIRGKSGTRFHTVIVNVQPIKDYYEYPTRKSGVAEHFLEFKERAAFYFQKGNASASGAIDRCGDAAERMGETARGYGHDETARP
jgi:hypothetical protein